MHQLHEPLAPHIGLHFFSLCFACCSLHLVAQLTDENRRLMRDNKGLSQR